MAAPRLLCRDVSLERPGRYGGASILHGVSAAFPVGEISLIKGAIGSGKTTLLHILATILRPSAGEVIADGEAVSRYVASHRDRWRRKVGIAFQGAHFMDELSVIENVMAPLIPTTPSLSVARRQAEEHLSRLEIAHLAGRRLAGLSGGERQRITLARALVVGPDFVFADEPTAHQDTEGAALIMARLARVASAGATVVVVSHDPRFSVSSDVTKTWMLTAGRLADAP